MPDYGQEVERMSKSKALWVAVEGLRASSLGRLLLLGSRAYTERAMALVREQGHSDLTVAHAGILPHIDIGGSRLTLVAERAGMTKQSASELVRALEGLGYLERQPVPGDRRAQTVAFTNRGRDFLLAAHRAKLTLEADLHDRLGPEGAKSLIEGLQRYVGIEPGGP